MKSRSGFTLIELLVVIAIMAVMAGMTITLVGSSATVQVKKEARHLVATLKYAYNQAVIRRVAYRVVFDLSEQEYWVEEGSDNFAISPTTEEATKDKKKDKKEDSESDESEGEGGEGEEAASSPPSFVIDDEGFVKKIKFDKEIRIRDVYVVHQEGLVVEGQAYLYFFPSGLTERAVIHLADENETINYSVIVNPITGRSRVLPEYVDYESVLEE